MLVVHVVYFESPVNSSTIQDLHFPVDCQLNSQLKLLRKTVAGRLKDTHGKNGDKQTNKTMKIKE